MTRNMGIYIQIDGQFQARVEEAWLEAAAKAALRACQRDEISISILVVDDDELRRYNRIYRRQDAPTDVLSFAIQEGPALAAEAPDALAAELDADLGDLVLAFPYASRQAIQHGHTLASELQLLVVHGTLHLLGYDHDTETRQAEMWRKQTEILSSLTDEDLTPRLTTPDW
ncbi:MAG: rRNA maturation RNase YbeY [Caldilineaceae bacterium SB0661_bin_32]|uniref:Endoribonuclease YbeY n=1 Tax=Caldilineaceae bacterium SB0661_bin_32 TaxID=2605255 RepID=A0A6B1DDS8_9CHLR|nr:rRNA maturation RNase YbeY [Caldilineaceae bacterium SB0661_bin_32]